VTLEEKVLWEKATNLAEDNLQARELFEKLKTNRDKVYMGITGLQGSEAVELEDGMKVMVAERDIAIVW